VRLERRGHAGEIATPEVERAVADHLFTLAAARGLQLRTDFTDPDYIVVAETLGDECGVALITRAMRTRYPFVHTR
jgi:tRNA(Ser,Leu) C12 N-acetylase TAN1